MAVGTHEMLLILRARDEASRVLRSFGNAFTDLDGASKKAAASQIAAGAAMTSVAVGIGAVAGASIGFMIDATKEAKEFEQGVKLAGTQQDKFKNSTKELGDVIKGVAKDIAVPLDTLDEGLFDIFSSMDVNLPQAERLLREFSKSAVAGATDLQTAGRATISIMNAWHLPVDEVNRVLDVQFQLVRKGVGTYEEFASTIGRAIPSAQRAGQSVETLAGMLAFLTRNGLSAAMAAASAGRAFDAFANEKVVGRLEKMGIQVRNADGSFRDLGGVIIDLQKKLANLTDPERAAALQDLFQGAGGTIQARRFFDLVLKDAAAAQQFVGLVGDMKNASGEFTKAYDQMAGTAQNKSQVLSNQWQIFKVQLGEALLPVLQELIKILQSVFNWWNNLSDGTKKTIMWIGIITTGFLALLAAVLAIAGVWAMLAGAAALLGIALGKLILIALAVAAAIAALIAVGYLIWKNWDTIKAALVKAWEYVWDKVAPVVRAIRDGIVFAFFWVRDRLVEFWNWLYEHFVGPMIELFVKMGDDIGKAVRAVGDYVTGTWDKISDWTRSRWDGIMTVLRPFIDFLRDYFVPGFEMIGNIVKHTWDFILDIFKNSWTTTVSILETLLSWIVDTFKFAWDIVVAVVQAAWTLIKGFIDFGVGVIMGIIDIIVGVFTGDWEKAWTGVKEIFKGVWDLIVAIGETAWILIKDIIWRSLQWIWTTVKDIFEIVKDVFKGFWQFVVDGFNWAVDLIGDIWNGIVESTKAPINFVIRYVYNDGIRWVWNKIAGFLGLGQLPEAALIGATAPQNTGRSGINSGGNIRFARGGILDGYEPGIDSVWALLSKGEGILVPEAVRGLGAGFVQWANAYFSNGRAGSTGGGSNRFADGGIVSTVLGFAGDVGSTIIELFKNPIGWITSRLGGSEWVKGAAGLMNKAIDGIVDKFWDFISSLGSTSAGGTAVSGNLQQWILAAMGFTGVPSSWYGPLTTLIMRESGGNPNAINLWDINAQRGDPSRGLMQTIGSTFAAYRDPRLPNNIYDPIANIVAGINYIKARYGTIFNVQQAVGSTPMGYDDGGMLPPGLGVFFNGTGRPERVLTDQQWDTVERAIDRATGRSTFGLDLGNGATVIYMENTFYVYTTGDDPEGLALALGRRLGEGVSR